MVYTWIVKFFKAENNYGFISNDDGGKDVFFHGSKVLGQIKKDDVVQFEIVEWKKGPEAQNVTPINAAPSEDEEGSEPAEQDEEEAE